MYRYRSIIKRIVDGDTIDVDIDLGFDCWLHNQRIRLLGIDAPETRTRDLEEKEKGLATKRFVENTMPLDTEFMLISKDYDGSRGKFGRILGDFQITEDQTLTQILLTEGLAEEYIV